MTKRKSLSEAVEKEIKTAFNLDKFKASKGLSSNVKFKEIIHLIPLSRIELKLLYNLMIISIPKAILKILAQLKIKQ